MRLVPATYLLLSISLTALSQPQTSSRIDGIGRFKIGKTTTAIIDSLVAERGGKVKEIEEQPMLEAATRSIYKLVPSTKTNYTLNSSLCPDTEVYLLGQVEVAGIKIRQVYLIFYQNVLAEFRSKTSAELSEALRLKFGKPTVDIRTKDEVCRYVRLGTEVVNKEVTEITSWSDAGARAKDVRMKHYDQKCNPIYSSYFSLSQEELLSAAIDCKKAWQDKVNYQKERQTRDKLKEF
ncbi:hypothetical protein [Fibrella aestuarina]|uniref:hypothetical protein n=1 Tax=Fibrella aestuarina TaxID=651143 RepID=UPI0011D2ABC8|nr:hypothetical protein [Fibrella aestuarina]